MFKWLLGQELSNIYEWKWLLILYFNKKLFESLNFKMHFFSFFFKDSIRKESKNKINTS